MEREIREGMTVRSSDGEKLGKVIRCDEDAFIIEKGFFFPKDYIVRYDQAGVRGGEVTLSLNASSLREAGHGARSGREHEAEASGMGTQTGTYATGESGAAFDGDRGRESRLGHGAGEEAPVSKTARRLERRADADARREERRADADVRREEVDVDDGDVEEGGSMKEPEE